MKIKPKKDPYEDYFNEGDLDGFQIGRIFPKRFQERRNMEVEINNEILYYDDLLDLDVEIETRQKNAMPKFTRKLSIDEMDELTDEQYIAYAQFLLDYKADQKSESLT